MNVSRCYNLVTESRYYPGDNGEVTGTSPEKDIPGVCFKIFSSYDEEKGVVRIFYRRNPGVR
jgi:hypothetical protein